MNTIDNIRLSISFERKMNQFITEEQNSIQKMIMMTVTSRRNINVNYIRTW
jgi:hypothetical protein